MHVFLGSLLCFAENFTIFSIYVRLYEEYVRMNVRFLIFTFKFDFLVAFTIPTDIQFYEI